MPYVDPDLAMFRARFPVFADSPDAQITLILAEAVSKVDQTWREADYQPAILYLAAHLLATDDSQVDDLVVVGDTGSANIASESFGGMSVSYAKNSATSLNAFVNEFSTTVYGKRFLTLVRANFPGMVLV
jgi:hypothetical protein